MISMQLNLSIMPRTLPTSPECRLCVSKSCACVQLTESHAFVSQVIWIPFIHLIMTR